MKKLLRILGTITIASSGMAGIVANSPMSLKREETLQDKDKLTVFQINNLEINTTKTISLNNYLKFINKDFKEIDEINKPIQNIAIDSQNNIYFNTIKDSYNEYLDSLYIFKYKEKKIISINFSDLIPDSNEELISLDIKNDDVYISFENDKIYLLKSGELTATKIENIPNNLIHYYIDKNNNNIYYQTKNKDLYILKSDELTATKINGINTDDIIWTIYIKENIIYFGDSNGAYFLKNGETIATKINGVKNNILAIAVDSQNNIYFSRWRDGLYLLKSNETKPIKFNKKHFDPSSIIIDKNDNIFLGEVDVSVRYLDSGKLIDILGKKMNTYLDFIIDNKNNIYFGTKNYDIYTIKNNNNVIQKIKNYVSTDVHNIGSSALSPFFVSPTIRGSQESFSERKGPGVYLLKNGESIAIRNEEINNIIVNSINIDKNNNIFFATNNGIYFKNSLVEINNNFNLGEIYSNEDKIIIANLFLEDPLIFKNKKIKIISKSSIYSKILIENGYSWSIINVNYQITNVININSFENLLNKLINVEPDVLQFLFPRWSPGATNVSISKIKSFVININNLNFGNVEVTRDSKLLHKTNFKEACFKKRERINTSSIKKTVKIPKCDYEQKSKLVFQITTGLTKTKQENKLNGWNINPDDEMKLHDFVNLNNKNSKIINVLSNEFDLSNTNKQEQEMILYSFSDVGDEIDLAPHERIIFKYSVRETNLETTLNLKQKISGTISVKIIDNNNEEQIITLSIKEAMQILKKYSLLPDKITINEDNSITFNGKAKISLTQEAEPKLIINTSII
ncbi:hypothetical protein [Spiroplasma endosymbiont of Dromius quadrimaculatus]|uniref:hypothetical protein n=1 Tax=Spiroplasma endosymbiont of Dromius quadrimaculatus TaxID=3066283 RepID=UPI00313C624A